MGDHLRVKICGVTRREDALAVEAAGADYLGMILSAGFSRSVDLAAAPAIVDGVTTMTVAVLVGEEAEAAEAAARAIGAGVIQLHGEEDPSVLADLHTRGAWKLWKAVRARSGEDVARTVEMYADVADGILVEGWRDGIVGGGGARVSLDPAEVRALVPEQLDFVLAGGLTPDSVADAVAAFEPDVVDVSSGVERAVGEKDVDLVSRFVAAVHGARGSAGTAATAAREVSG